VLRDVQPEKSTSFAVRELGGVVGADRLTAFWPREGWERQRNIPIKTRCPAVLGDHRALFVRESLLLASFHIVSFGWLDRQGPREVVREARAVHRLVALLGDVLHHVPVKR
jgi:hypothetical protein